MHQMGVYTHIYIQQNLIYACCKGAWLNILWSSGRWMWELWDEILWKVLIKIYYIKVYSTMRCMYERWEKIIWLLKFKICFRLVLSTVLVRVLSITNEWCIGNSKPILSLLRITFKLKKFQQIWQLGSTSILFQKLISNLPAVKCKSWMPTLRWSTENHLYETKYE